MSVKNKLFAKSGHDCTIGNGLEDLPMFRQSPNILTQIKNILVRFRMASELNFRCQSFLRSQKNVDYEHRRHVKYLYIIHPFSDFRKYWEIFMMIVLLTQFLMIPLDVSFFKLKMVDNCTTNAGWKTIRVIADSICILDIVMTFFTGYCDYNRKIVVMDPKGICVNYLWSYFIPDLVSSVPTGYGIDEDNNILTTLTYLAPLRLIRIISFLRYCKQFCQTYAVSYTTYKIVLIFIMYMLYWHIICCITIFLATRDITTRVIPTSMYNPKRKDMPYNLLYNVETTYFFVFYETSRLINNAGYLEVSHQDKYTYYVVAIWLASKLFYMYLTSLVLDVVISKTSAVQKYFELVSELKDYMGHNQLPVYLQKRLLVYYDFRYERTYFREHEILNTISGQLRQEVVMHKCRKLVEHVDFFKNLPQTLLLRIVSVLHQEFFLTNDVIIKIGTFGDCMYFIALGTVAIYTSSGREICHLSDGDHFGEIALVEPNEHRTAAVIAAETSELFRLDRIDFIRAIMPYPDLLTRIEQIAQIRLQETTEMNARTNDLYSEVLSQTFEMMNQ